MPTPVDVSDLTITMASELDYASFMTYTASALTKIIKYVNVVIGWVFVIATGFKKAYLMQNFIFF